MSFCYPWSSGYRSLCHSVNPWSSGYRSLCHSVNPWSSGYRSLCHSVNPWSSGDMSLFNPLSPHDALKHHFTSLKTQFISLQLRFLEGKFPLNWFNNKWQFSLIFLPHHVIFTHYKTRIVVGEDDNGKFRLERVKSLVIWLQVIISFLCCDSPNLKVFSGKVF